MAAPGPARADAPDGLDVRLPRTAFTAAGALALWGAAALARPALLPASCRWCEPPGVDRAARDAAVLANGAAAARASDVLSVGLPFALAGADVALASGSLRRVGEDVLVAAEALGAAGVATELLKPLVARLRPGPWAARGGGGADDRMSFPSGHTSNAFAAASAFGTIARLRGDPAWPAVYAGGYAVAAAVGWLRMAADHHWLSDVAAGAALGTAAGLALPLLHRADRRPEAGAAAAPVRLAVTPLPLGVAGTW